MSSLLEPLCCEIPHLGLLPTLAFNQEICQVCGYGPVYWPHHHPLHCAEHALHGLGALQDDKGVWPHAVHWQFGKSVWPWSATWGVDFLLFKVLAMAWECPILIKCQHCFAFVKPVHVATSFWRELNEEQVSIFIKLTYSNVISNHQSRGFGLFLIDICLRKWDKRKVNELYLRFLVKHP